MVNQFGYPVWFTKLKQTITLINNQTYIIWNQKVNNKKKDRYTPILFELLLSHRSNIKMHELYQSHALQKYEILLES